MKRLLFFIIVLFLTVLATALAVRDPGYVLIARAPWSIELPLTLFVLFLFLFMAALYAIGFAVQRSRMIPRYFARKRHDNITRNAYIALNEGLANLAQGNYERAEALLSKTVHSSETPLLNYLGAAYAAQAQGNIKKRDKFLSQAREGAPDYASTIGLIHARLQHQAGQTKQALATLSELETTESQRGSAVKLLLRIYRTLQDWTALAALLPEARKLGVRNEEELTELELKAHTELLKLSLPSDSAHTLKKAWYATPRHLQQHPQLIAAYASQLAAQNQADEAEKLLHEAIHKEYSDKLVELYGRVESSNLAQQLTNVEKWLANQPENPALLAATGRLAAKNGFLEKAFTCLQKAISLNGNMDIYLELGNILQQQGKTAQAIQTYRQGLKNIK